MQLPILQPESAPFNGPQSARSTLLASVSGAPYEGLWTPSNFMKSASIEAVGSAESFALDFFGSNSDAWPMNTYEVTVAATSITAGDIATLMFTPALSQTGAIAVPYTIGALDSPSTIAAGLATSVTASAALKALGISASAAGAVVTVTWPSQSQAGLPGSNYSPSNPYLANFLALAGAVSGSATESLTIATGTDGSPIGSLTAFGLYPLTQWPARWIKARLSSLVGANAAVSAKFHGVA